VTSKQYRSLAKYAGSIAADLGLRDWDIAIRDDPPDDGGALASTECVYGRRQANIRFSPDFAHHAPEEQRTAVLHELLHVHLWAADQAVRDGLTVLGSEAREVVYAGYNTAREYAVDAVATAIADRYPLWTP
jgi:hypothetical protein